MTSSCLAIFAIITWFGHLRSLTDKQFASKFMTSNLKVHQEPDTAADTVDELAAKKFIASLYNALFLRCECLLFSEINTRRS